jgi:hypothetical protein
MLNNSKHAKVTAGIMSKSKTNISKELLNKSERTNVPRSLSSLSVKPTSLVSDSVPTSTNLKQVEYSIRNASFAYDDSISSQRLATGKSVKYEYEEKVDASISWNGANTSAGGTGADTYGAASRLTVGAGGAAALYDPLEGTNTGICLFFSITLCI